MFTALMILVGIVVALVVGAALAINYAEAKVEREKHRHGWD